MTPIANVAELGAANEAINARTQAAFEMAEQQPRKDYSGMLPKQPEYMGDVAQLAAQRRAHAAFAPKYQQMQIQQKLSDRMDTYNRMSEAMTNETQRLRLQYAKEYAEKKRRMQEEAMRSQALAGVLGLAGMVAGAYFGGGTPTGAAAGAMIGQKAGEAVGNSGVIGG